MLAEFSLNESARIPGGERVCVSPRSISEGSMPLDGQNIALAIPDTLRGALIESGIKTVEPHVIDAHKAEELRRHPANWLYRHRVALQIASLGLLFSISVGLARALSRCPLAGSLGRSSRFLFCMDWQVERRR